MNMILFVLLAGQTFDLQPNSRETRKWITFLEVERAEQTRMALHNAEQYVPRFKRTFRAEGVPEDLVWLALIESSFRIDPTSPSKAQGMFQFKKETARAFGLKVTRRVDQRNHPDKAAAAAARYLKYLHNKFKNWDLVLAAYNLGEGDLRRAMQRRRVTTWRQIKPHVRKETREYVGKIKAAAVVGNAYLAGHKPKSWDQAGRTHQVVKGDTLFNIAQRYNLEIDDIRRLNNIKGNKIRLGQILLLPEAAPVNR